MRIRRTSQILTMIIIALSLVAVACTFGARYYRNTQEGAYETRRKMFNFTEQLAQGSDRLTAAVRAYASIGHLNNFDSAATECFEKNRAVFENLLTGETLSSFSQHLEKFAFNEALEQLKPAAKEKGFL